MHDGHAIQQDQGDDMWSFIKIAATRRQSMTAVFSIISSMTALMCIRHEAKVPTRRRLNPQQHEDNAS